MNFGFGHSMLKAACLILLLSGPSLVAQEKKAESADDDFKILFDGTNLDHWRGYQDEKVGAGWKIDGDTLHFDGKSGGGDIVTKGEFDNFELHFDWKVSEGANSGVMFRVSLGDSAPYMSGPEYQILDDDKHPDGKNEITSAGSLYGLCVPDGKEINSVGEWNTAKIILNGKMLEHWVNGKKVVSVEIDSDDWKTRLGKSKFKDWKKFAKNDIGHLAFQDHGDEVWFRNIKIKELGSND